MQSNLKNISLTLFFTKGVGLKTWKETGNLDRELAIYEELSKSLKIINFVTYKGNSDKKFSKDIKRIKVLSSSWHISQFLTLGLLFLKYKNEIQKTDILKTNQIPGSEIAIWFKKKFHKKLIVRCGYLHSEFTKKQTKDKKEIKKALELEKKAFEAADIGIVTSDRQRNIVIKQHNLDPFKIRVISNYVVTDVFKPNNRISRKYDIVFVGRSDTQKNLENFLKALILLKEKKQNISLLLIGGCCKDKAVKSLVKKHGLNVFFAGNIPNFKLPDFLNQAKIFILPSFYEGHPKALLEAMSCGLPCIGTRVSGIREEIRHLETGYLCGTNYESIVEAIKLLLENENLRNELGKNAREYIVNNYSLSKIKKIELDIINEIMHK